MVDIARKNGIKESTYYSRLERKWDKERAANEPVHVYKGEYAIYRNDVQIASGTDKECAEKLGVTSEYIRWMSRPSAKKRLADKKNPEMATTAIKLDELDDDDD